MWASRTSQPDFLKGFGSEIADTSVADIRTYLTWHVLEKAAPLLCGPFVQEDFSFNDRDLRGVQEMQPRRKRCVVLVDRSLGEALGQVYAGFRRGRQRAHAEDGG